MDFLGTVNTLGAIPLLTLIVVIFILLFREVKKDNKRISEALESHSAKIDKQIREYKAITDRQIEAQNIEIGKMEERLRIVESDYAKKTDVQEAISGWRMEIRHINDKLDRILMSK